MRKLFLLMDSVIILALTGGLNVHAVQLAQLPVSTDCTYFYFHTWEMWRCPGRIYVVYAGATTPTSTLPTTAGETSKEAAIVTATTTATTTTTTTTRGATTLTTAETTTTTGKTTTIASNLTSELWRETAYLDQRFLVDTQKECRTSKTDAGYRNRGRLDAPCKFPFVVRGKTYFACTYDYGHVTGYRPWCSTNTTEDNRHVSGGKNWGVCDDFEMCSIPPRFCGEPVRTRPLPDDRDDDVQMEQMPWMVSLGRHKSRNFWSHECGGSLVSNKHVLSAAHCFNNMLGANDEYNVDGYKMRLGSADLWSTSEGNGVERRVLQVLVHPKFIQGRAYFDVGVAVADELIEFTNTVMPICLPMRPVDDFDALADDFVNLAGWGYEVGRDGNLTLNSKLKLVSLQVNPKDVCEDIFSTESIKASALNIPTFKVKRQIPNGFTQDISCVGNDFFVDQAACDGDSGSPVIKRVSGSARGRPFFEQHFIVSTGVDCKFKATIYARVTDRQILTWVQSVTESTPLLMVVGGFSAARGGLTNDIELISTKKNNLCSKHVKPIFGKAFNISGNIIQESAVLGATGQYANEAPIVCGGKNAFDNLATCYEFNATENQWYPIPSMRLKRHYATSVLDEQGDLWVLGGTHNSSNAQFTEVYQYKPKPRAGRWFRGYPMPSDLRDTGLSSQCSVRLNSTHVFMAGGYAQAYVFCDTVKKNDSRPGDGAAVGGVPNPRLGDDGFDVLEAVPCGDEAPATAEGPLGGGRVMDRAWMYDGREWTTLPAMSTVRDRPACSLVQFPNGKIKILVAGGCAGWCVENPPLSSAEMYDPETDEWTRVADLPIPLSSARMELLEGVPTLIGGYDGIGQNGFLIQYVAETDEWVPNPSVRLRIPRSSAAVFQVPKHMFKNC